MRHDTLKTAQLTQNVYFQLNFRFTFSHYKNDNYMKLKSNAKKKKKKEKFMLRNNSNNQCRVRHIIGGYCVCVKQKKSDMAYTFPLIICNHYFHHEIFFFIRRPPHHNHQCPLIHLQQSAFCLRQTRREQ